jgi:agmatine deiminase
LPRCAPRGRIAASGVGGEFHSQSAILLSCGELSSEHPQVFVDLVGAIHPNVRLVGLCRGRDEKRAATALLMRHGLPADALEFRCVPTDTAWIRDYGPLFVKTPDGRTEIVDLDCTGGMGAGGDSLDDDVPRAVANQFRLPSVCSELRLQGGNLLANGDGLVLTTEAILEDNADLGYTKPTIEALLRMMLGCRQWLCLAAPEGEPTGHVDVFVAFLSEDLVVVAQCDAAVDPNNARILDGAAETLARVVTSKGPMRVLRVPAFGTDDGTWRSYTNVVFANGVLAVPAYRDVDPVAQQRVLDLYGQHMPGWRVVGINADSLAALGGGLHCVTLNVPGFVRLEPLANSWPAFGGMEEPSERLRDPGASIGQPWPPAGCPQAVRDGRTGADDD